MADTLSDMSLAFSAHDVKLPLRRTAECDATLVDADGRDVLTVDVNTMRPDSDVEAIVQLLMNIINSSAGRPIGTEQATAERAS